jgi:hypothetical protein
LRRFNAGFLALSEGLHAHLEELTDRVIRAAINEEGWAASIRSGKNSRSLLCGQPCTMGLVMRCRCARGLASCAIQLPMMSESLLCALHPHRAK